MIARVLLLATSVAGTAALALPEWIQHSPILVWNASASAPLGLYRVAPTDALEIGTLVIIKPPEELARFLVERAYLPIGVPLLKHVAAQAGQTICRKGSLITVDGAVTALARDWDGKGRALPVWQGCRVLSADEIFVLNSDVPDSFDGRYFGPLLASTIVGRAIALLTFGGAS
jgi:conjugative transfer signal peptidase TraF